MPRHTDPPPAPSSRRAMVTAILLLLAAGGAYRAMERSHQRLDQSEPLAPRALEKLPLHLGDWDGSDVPIDAEIVKKTRTDQHLNRLYRHRAGRPPVFLFIAYGVNMRDLLPHRPEVCYPGAGWALKNTTTVELPGAWNGQMLTCQVHRFQRGVLGAEQITVLNYYVVSGVTCPDVTLLREKASLAQGGARYSAQIQITCSGDAFREASSALAATRDFAALSADLIRAVLPSSPAISAPASSGAIPGATP